jgi:hypothetical protein
MTWQGYSSTKEETQAAESRQGCAHRPGDAPELREEGPGKEEHDDKKGRRESGSATEQVS